MEKNENNNAGWDSGKNLWVVYQQSVCCYSNSFFHRETVSKRRKTCGFTRQILFGFLIDFYFLETLVLCQVQTFETAWEMLMFTSSRKHLFWKTRIFIFGKLICCFYNQQSRKCFDNFTSNIPFYFFHPFIIFHQEKYFSKSILKNIFTFLLWMRRY